MVHRRVTGGTRRGLVRRFVRGPIGIVGRPVVSGPKLQSFAANRSALQPSQAVAKPITRQSREPITQDCCPHREPVADLQDSAACRQNRESFEVNVANNQPHCEERARCLKGIQARVTDQQDGQGSSRSFKRTGARAQDHAKPQQQVSGQGSRARAAYHQDQCARQSRPCATEWQPCAGTAWITNRQWDRKPSVPNGHSHRPSANVKWTTNRQRDRKPPSPNLGP